MKGGTRPHQSFGRRDPLFVQGNRHSQRRPGLLFVVRFVWYIRSGYKAPWIIIYPSIFLSTGEERRGHEGTPDADRRHHPRLRGAAAGGDARRRAPSLNRPHMRNKPIIPEERQSCLIVFFLNSCSIICGSIFLVVFFVVVVTGSALRLHCPRRQDCCSVSVFLGNVFSSSSSSTVQVSPLQLFWVPQP